jgi:hypothetical protein
MGEACEQRFAKMPPRLQALKYLLPPTRTSVKYQQNFGSRTIVIVVRKCLMAVLRRYVEAVVVAVDAAKPGSYAEFKVTSSRVSERVSFWKRLRKAL